MLCRSLLSAGREQFFLPITRAFENPKSWNLALDICNSGSQEYSTQGPRWGGAEARP